MKSILTLLFLLMSTGALGAEKEVFDTTAVLEKQESQVLSLIDAYRSRVTESEKFDARTALLKQLGQTAELLKSTLNGPALSNLSLQQMTELLAKLDPYDFEHVVLEEIEPQITKIFPRVESAARELFIRKKITRKEYTSLKESIEYIKMNSDEDEDSE